MLYMAFLMFFCPRGVFICVTCNEKVNCTFRANRAGGSADEEVTAVSDEAQDDQEGNAEMSQKGTLERRRRKQGHGIGGALAAISSSPVLTGCSFSNNNAVAELSASSGGGELVFLNRGVGCVRGDRVKRWLCAAGLRAVVAD